MGRRAASCLLAGLLGLQGALAGLENAVHSRKLDHANFDASISEPEVGTLTAFFAPWCGHCKSLLSTWDQVAATFKEDSKCRVAHFDANDAANRDIASRYDVSGFPTIKMVFKDTTKSPLTYEEPRTTEAFIKFLNKQCGTHRASGGLLLPEAGRLEALDKLVSSFWEAPVPERPAFVKLAKSLAAVADTPLAPYYAKVIDKVLADESWLSKEAQRQKKLAEKGATMAAAKFEELQMKQNILQVFVTAKKAAEGGAGAAKEGAEEEGAHKATGEL